MICTQPYSPQASPPPIICLLRQVWPLMLAQVTQAAARLLCMHLVYVAQMP